MEIHPLKPFLPEKARLLMLGSFPPSQARWSMEFFYPNYINDMWRIFGLLYFNDKDHFADVENRRFRKQDIIDFLTDMGIALYDTACRIRRTKNTASDKDLEIVEETDIKAMLRKIPLCNAIVATGEKAASVVARQMGCEVPKVGSHVGFSINGREMRLFRMPSSSRAYPMKLEKKAEFYRGALTELGIGI